MNQTILNRVKTRVMHQLVSSLIYENIVVYKASYQDGVGHFTIEGHDSEYRFTAKRHIALIVYVSHHQLSVS